MTLPRYTRNSAGLQQILMSDGVGDHIENVARAGVGYAETIAPRRTGRYASELTVVPIVATLPTPRRAAAIYALAPYSWKVEQRHHVLSRVADALEAASVATR